MTVSVATQYVPASQFSELVAGPGDWEVVLTAVVYGLWVTTTNSGVSLPFTGAPDVLNIGPEANSSVNGYYLAEGQTRVLRAADGDHLFVASDQASGDWSVCSFVATQIGV